MEYEPAFPNLMRMGAGSVCLVNSNLVASASAVILIVAPLSDAPVIVVSFSPLVRWACGFDTLYTNFQK